MAAWRWSSASAERAGVAGEIYIITSTGGPVDRACLVQDRSMAAPGRHPFLTRRLTRVKNLAVSPVYNAVSCRSGS